MYIELTREDMGNLLEQKFITTQEIGKQLISPYEIQDRFDNLSGLQKEYWLKKIRKNVRILTDHEEIKRYDSMPSLVYPQ